MIINDIWRVRRIDSSFWEKIALMESNYLIILITVIKLDYFMPQNSALEFVSSNW